MVNLYFLRSVPTFHKGLFFLVLLVGFGTKLNAQTSQKPGPPPPLPVREISGIVKDTTEVGIPGVTIRLTSANDTLVISTNPDGIFVFKNVKSATYTLSVSMMSYKPLIAKFKQNDAVARIVMDPIILKSQSNTLNEVVINGTPSITYKTDTVEYRASDYIVRQNATVDELIKKMEGMEVGTDGSVIHQGTSVTKAKINGKTYLGGDVATAIQNLPAEIVEKIQVVDDYGDQAARTGIKDGDPEKILNIVTRADKSVGNTANLAAAAGNNERYEGSVFATRLNANQTIGVNARLNNTINGIANSGSNGSTTNTGNNGGRGGNGGGSNGGNGGNSSGSSTGGNPGTTNSGNGSFSYRDQLSKKVKINTNYGYNFSNTNSINNSFSGTPSREGTIFSTDGNASKNDSKTHNFSFELEADLDSANFLRISPTITYTSTDRGSSFSNFQTGGIKRDETGSSTSLNTRPNLGITAFYQHIFKKPRRNISVQLSLNNTNQKSEQERNSDIINYDETTGAVTTNIFEHLLIERENLTRNYRASMTFAEPLSTNTQLEFNGQINYNGYDNTATSSNILPNGSTQVLDNLSNIYDYSFTQTRLALNYRYGVTNASKVKFSLGLTAVPGLLTGTKVSLGTSTHRSSFNLIPIARFQYLWSRQHSIQINYSGNANEPSFDQIQPVRDVSNTRNPVVGNPNLIVSFNHSINTNYNNYIANSKLNYSVNANATFTDNAIIRNSVRVKDPNGDDVIETRFVNLNGVYRLNGNYSISKQLNDRKYNLSLNGNVAYNHNVAMSDDIQYTTTSWSFNERFGPRINPNEWLEVNPNLGYSYTKSNTTLVTASNSETKIKTLTFNIDGKIYMWKTLIFGYSASKNYITGLNSNVTSNPFVINSYLQKEFWKRKATFTFQAFDILKQNNFVNHVISDNGGFVDTKSNALSRYFMLRLTVRLQKWSGVKPRNGQQMMRRGDGSFNQN